MVAIVSTIVKCAVKRGCCDVEGEMLTPAMSRSGMWRSCAQAGIVGNL